MMGCVLVNRSVQYIRCPTEAIGSEDFNSSSGSVTTSTYVVFETFTFVDK